MNVLSRRKASFEPTALSELKISSCWRSLDVALPCISLPLDGRPLVRHIESSIGTSEGREDLSANLLERGAMALSSEAPAHKRDLPCSKRSGRAKNKMGDRLDRSARSQRSSLRKSLQARGRRRQKSRAGRCRYYSQGQSEKCCFWCEKSRTESAQRRLPAKAAQVSGRAFKPAFSCDRSRSRDCLSQLPDLTALHHSASILDQDLAALC